MDNFLGKRHNINPRMVSGTENVAPAFTSTPKRNQKAVVAEMEADSERASWLNCPHLKCPQQKVLSGAGNRKELSDAGSVVIFVWKSLEDSHEHKEN